MRKIKPYNINSFLFASLGRHVVLYNCIGKGEHRYISKTHSNVLIRAKIKHQGNGCQYQNQIKQLVLDTPFLNKWYLKTSKDESFGCRVSRFNQSLQ